MTARSPAAAWTSGWASTSAGRCCASGMGAIGPDCSAGAAEGSRDTVTHHPRPGEPLMSRLGFGAFLAPHPPIGEHPMLQFRRDLDLVELLDRLGGRTVLGGGDHSAGGGRVAPPRLLRARA